MSAHLWITTHSAVQDGSPNIDDFLVMKWYRALFWWNPIHILNMYEMYNSVEIFLVIMTIFSWFYLYNLYSCGVGRLPEAHCSCHNTFGFYFQRISWSVQLVLYNRHCAIFSGSVQSMCHWFVMPPSICHCLGCHGQYTIILQSHLWNANALESCHGMPRSTRYDSVMRHPMFFYPCATRRLLN